MDYIGRYRLDMVELLKTVFPIRKYGFIQLPSLKSNLGSLNPAIVSSISSKHYFYSSHIPWRVWHLRGDASHDSAPNGIQTTTLEHHSGSSISYMCFLGLNQVIQDALYPPVRWCSQQQVATSRQSVHAIRRDQPYVRKSAAKPWTPREAMGLPHAYPATGHRSRILE